MNCLPKNAATRRYTQRSILGAAIYILAIFADAWLFPRYHIGGTLAYALAVVPALPIIGMLGSVALYLGEEKDEFQRNVFILAMVWAVGATLSVTTVWGCLETFTRSAHLSVFWIYPIYWAFVGIATFALQLRYR